MRRTKWRYLCPYCPRRFKSASDLHKHVHPKGSQPGWCSTALRAVD